MTRRSAGESVGRRWALLRGGLSMNVNVEPLSVSLNVSVVVVGDCAVAGAAATTAPLRAAGAAGDRRSMWGSLGVGDGRSCPRVRVFLRHAPGAVPLRGGSLSSAGRGLGARAAAVALTLAQRGELRPRPRVGDIARGKPGAARGDDPPAHVLQAGDAV